jgi:hypothetical protein
MTPSFSQDGSKSGIVPYYRWLCIFWKFFGLAFISFCFDIFQDKMKIVFIKEELVEKEEKDVRNYLTVFKTYRL